MRTTRRTGPLALLCAVQALACAADDSTVPDESRVDEAAPSLSGPLCASCATTGGETGDFPGGGAPAPDPCEGHRRTPADETLVVPSGLSARSAIDLVQRQLLLPAEWRATEQSQLRKTSGFTPETELRLTVQVTGVEQLDFVAGEEPEESAVQAACEGIDLTADVTLDAGDGSLSGVFEGAVIHVYSATEAALQLSADISQFTGSLRLGAREGERLRAILSVNFEGGRVRGALMPIVERADVDSFADDARPADYRPLELHWPGTDSCNSYSFPYTGEEADRIAAPTKAQFSTGSTYRAVYFQPTYDVGDPVALGDTEMTVEVGSPALVCEGRSGFQRPAERYQELQLPVRFISSDGRYDLSVPLDVTAAVWPESASVALAQFESGALPVAEFQSRFGIGSLDFGSSPCAALRVLYYVQPLNEYSRLIQVEAGDCGDGTRLTRARMIEMLGNQ